MNYYLNQLVSYFRASGRQLYHLVCLPTQFEREAEHFGHGGPNRSYPERIKYLLKFAPWVVAFNVLANVTAGYLCKSYGFPFEWGPSWVGTFFGVTGGAAFGAVGGFSRAVGGIFGGWALGVALGMAGGMSVSSTVTVVGARVLGISCGTIFRKVFAKEGWIRSAIVVAVAVALSLAVAGAVMVVYWLRMAGGMHLGVGPGLAVGLAFGIAGGLGAGIAFGVTFSPESGLAFGVAGGAAFGLAFGATIAMLAGVATGAAAGGSFAISFPLLFWLTYFRLLTYPFDVSLSAVTYLTGRRYPQELVRAWRWCPVRWNEVIWLPLPFVSRLLALLVQKNRDEGFREVAVVAAERPLQRRIAFNALMEVAIADLKAATVSELSAVTEKLNWTTDAPAELPSELMTTLSRLDRIAQYVGQYLTLYNAYRKNEALEHAVTEVGALQRTLIAARGRFAPRLLQVTNEWRSLLDAERAITKSLAEAKREIPNPFVLGSPVRETEHNVFTGRQDIVRQIEASVLGAAQAPTLLLHGPRRMGKTSILNQLPRLLGPDFAPAVVDCQNPAVTESRTTLLRYLSRACGEGLRRRHVRVEPLTAAKLEREPFAVFDEWLDAVERAMPEGMRALLCLDEYERLQATLDAGWGGAFLDALRHTLQHRPRVVLMFTGAHTFQELGPEWTDRFISARRVRVSFLGREDVELLLTRPIPEFDMKYAPGALDAVVAATRCQPFLTQAVAFELVQHLNERQRKEATPADVEEAVARALVSGGEYFANVWSDAGAEGQAILRALAAGETPPDSPASRAWLREHDVLDAEGRFAVEMVKRWVK